MLILIRSTLLATLKPIAGIAIGGAILWHVAMHSGAPNGIAYVHVSADQVDVMVDHTAHHVESRWDSPIVCELRAGKHVLQMTRNGQTLFEEEFTLNSGAEVVLTAWERSEGAGVKPPSP
jgi:hypothetical protein